MANQTKLLNVSDEMKLNEGRQNFRIIINMEIRQSMGGTATQHDLEYTGMRRNKKSSGMVVLVKYVRRTGCKMVMMKWNIPVK